MDYAILFRRELINETNMIYCLRPCYVAKGIYDDETNTFIDELNVERYLYDDPEMFFSNAEFFVGDICSEEELMNTYPDCQTLENAILNYFSDANNHIYISTYNEENDSVIIEVSPIEGDLDNEPYTSSDKSKITDKDREEYYQELKEQYNFDFTFLNETEILNILNNDDIDEVKKELQKQKEDKLSYYEKTLSSGNKISLCIHDELIDELLSFSSIDDIHENLNNLYEASIKELEKRNSVKEEKNNSILKCNIDLEDLEAGINKIEVIIDGYTKTINKFGIEKFANLSQFLAEYKKLLSNLRKTEDKNKVKEQIEKFKKKNEKTIKLAQSEIDNLISEKSKFTTKPNNEVENKIMREQKQKELEETFAGEQKASYALDYVTVHDKMVSRIIDRDEQIDKLLNCIDRNDNVENLSKRHFSLIAGTTGTGKTQTFTELKNALIDCRPVHIVNTNKITQEGYVGEDLETAALKPLVIEANRINTKKGLSTLDKINELDINLAQHGILILDEIDKRANKGNGEVVNSSGVIDMLLKLMDVGTIYNVPVADSGPFTVTKPFDSSNLTIFASGAFQEYFDDLENKKNSNFGFNKNEETEADKFFKYKEVKPEDLAKYGLSSQFLGRYSNVILYPKHTKETLKELETTKYTSNIYEEQYQLSKKGIILVWAYNYLDILVDEAYKINEGGRGLRNIVARTLGNLDIEVRNRPGEFKIVYLPETVFESSDNIILLRQDNSVVTLGELRKQTIERNKSLRNMEKISMDEDALNEINNILANVAKDKPKVKSLGAMQY